MDDVKGYVGWIGELEQYLRLLCKGWGGQRRLQALGLYATGLLLSGERKSIAPMAARLSASAAGGGRDAAATPAGGGRRKVGSRGFCLRGLRIT